MEEKQGEAKYIFTSQEKVYTAPPSYPPSAEVKVSLPGEILNQTVIIKRFANGIGFEIEADISGALTDKTVEELKLQWQKLKEAFKEESGYNI